MNKIFLVLISVFIFGCTTPIKIYNKTKYNIKYLEGAGEMVADKISHLDSNIIQFNKDNFLCLQLNFFDGEWFVVCDHYCSPVYFWQVIQKDDNMVIEYRYKTRE